jgi:hypothetical protein
VQELLNAAEAGGLRMVRWPVFIGSMTFLLPLVLKLTSDVIELDAWNGAARRWRFLYQPCLDNDDESDRTAHKKPA